MEPSITRRPGGRSARVRRAVLDAAVDLLVEAGSSAFSIADVASRAGVHETTLYRRWGSVDRLVLDALLDRSVEQIPTPDTGSILTDLVALGERLVVSVASPLGGAILRSMAASTDEVETASLRTQFWNARSQEAEKLVERSQARGELSADVNGRRLLEMFVAPIHLRLLLTHEPIDRAFLSELAEASVRGATPPKH